MQLRGQRFDALIALAIGALFVAEGAGEHGFAGHRPAGILVGVVYAATLVLRRQLPIVPMAGAVFVIEFANLAGPNALGDTAAFLFAVVITIYSAGAYAQRRMLAACALLVAAAIPLAAIEPGQSLSASDIGFFVMFFGGPFVAGQVMRRRRAREKVLETEGEERAREAVSEERARIARELHDVTAHAVSVVVLQARGARKLLGDGHPDVRRALDTIERSASDALTEMRRLLSLLREQDEAVALAPQPRLQALTTLAERARAAGLDIELEIVGGLDDLPAGIDVSAYRIVQEALTNAIKHAGPARATVKIARSEHQLEIEVADDGAGTTGAESGGHGLIGMRERVAIYGGSFQAGPREGARGFALRVELPLQGAA